MSNNLRPEHISEEEWRKPELNPNFWDCECEGGPDQYIKHKATQLFCDACGAHEDEMPDSHQREVDLMRQSDEQQDLQLLRKQL